MSESSLDSANLNILNFLGISWARLRDNWLQLMLTLFIREVICLLFAGVAFSIFVDWRGWNFAIAWLVKILTWAFLQSGCWKIFLAVSREQKFSYADLFSGISMTLTMLFASACFYLLVTIGLIALLLPAFYVGGTLSLYGLCIVERKNNFFHSLSESYRLLKGYRLHAILVLVISVLGIYTFLGTAFEAFYLISLSVLFAHISDRISDQTNNRTTPP